MGQHCLDCLARDGVQRTPDFGDRGIRPMATTRVVPTKPYVTYGLIAVNVLVFLLCAAQAGFGDPGAAPLFAEGDLLKSDVASGEYWRLLTAGFLHFSVMHIAVNMLSLYILGRDLELALGMFRYLAIYLIALLGGSAAVMLFEADRAVTAGASGAIYGLMGAMLVIILKARVSPVPVLSIIAFNVVLSFSLPGISVLGHLGGLAFGAAATAAVVYFPGLVLPPGGRTPEAASRVGWVALAALFVLAIALGVAGGVAYDGPIYIR
ncbi:Rhomboid protease gluP [Gordonia paraffinivorans]|uniref:Rhomboid protease gluP n=2 Tax=Gordonia paraffinivorans TaxID=175628 RepID=A0ABD7V4J5_9ACTN|nr:Rhomboid protease gluP [Gordonia paraffinivorans]